MSNFKLTIKKDAIDAIVHPIFKQKVEELHQEFQVTLASPLFAWGSTTKRRNGQTVSDPRDAIDLGGLRDGQKLTFLSPKLAKIEWEAPYTEKVFDHATVDLVDFTLERLNS